MKIKKINKKVFENLNFRKMRKKQKTGRAGFEPADAGIRIQSLTTWRPANNNILKISIGYIKYLKFSSSKREIFI